MIQRPQWLGLSDDQNTVTLTRFNGEFKTAEYFTPKWAEKNPNRIRKAAIVDLETTGLDIRKDKIIEIGIRNFLFDRSNGEVLKVEGSYSALQDPCEPLNRIVQTVTGLTNKMLDGHSIEWGKVSSLLDDRDLIIAHNAGFDRPILERFCDSTKEKIWGCSVSQIDWMNKGYSSAKLELLCIHHGFFTQAHRAIHDCDALLHLLSFKDQFSHEAHLNELIQTARKPIVHIYATNSPFESKDDLKIRGYRWNNNTKTWSKQLPKESVDEEIAWMETIVYNGSFGGEVKTVPLNGLFK